MVKIARLFCFLVWATPCWGQSSLNLMVPVGHAEEINGIEVSNDNKLIITTAQDGQVIAWNEESGNIIKSFHFDKVARTRQWNIRISISPDSKMIGVRANDGEDYFRVWDLIAGRDLIYEKGNLLGLGQKHGYIMTNDYPGDFVKIDLANGKKDTLLRSVRQFANKNFNNKAHIIFQMENADVYYYGTDGLRPTRIYQAPPNWGERERQDWFYAFSPALDRVIISVPGAFVYQYNIKTAAATRLPGNYIAEGEVTVSPDGRYLHATCMDGVRHWDLLTGALVKNEIANRVTAGPIEFIETEVKEKSTVQINNKISGKQASIGFTSKVQYDNNRKVAVADGKTVSIVDVASLTRRDFKPLNQSSVPELLFFDENSLSMISDGKLGVIDLDESKFWFSNLETKAIATVSSTREVGVSGDNKIRFINTKLRKATDSVDLSTLSETLYGEVIVPLRMQITNGKEFVSFQHSITTYAVKNFEGNYSHPREMFMDEGSGYDPAYRITPSQVVYALKPVSLTQLMPANSDWQFETGFSHSKDGMYVANADRLALYKFDTRYENPVEVKNVLQERFSLAEFSNSNNLLATVSSDNSTIQLYSLPDKKATFRLPGHGTRVRRLSFSMDEKLLASVAIDESIKIWDLKSGRELCTIRIFPNQNWVVSTPVGFFDASPEIMEKLYFVYGLETISLSQLKERFYKPDLLKQLMSEGLSSLKGSEDLSKLEPYPDVQLKFDEKNVILKIDLTNTGGGIGKIQVSINGTEIMEDVRVTLQQPLGQLENKSSLSVVVPLAKNNRMVWGSRNFITVKAQNKAGYVTSRAKGIIYDAPERADVVGNFKPSLYAIVSGCSDYTGKSLDLKYAAKDAADFANALRVAGKNLFNDRVSVNLLTTDEKDAAQRPSKKNLVKAFNDVAKKATLADIFIIYFSGHGTHSGRENDFVYLTQEAASFNVEDPAIRKGTSLSSQEIAELLKTIAAQKQVLIIDACASGKVVDNLVSKGDSPGTLKALDRLKDRMGTYIITGCAADAVSYEASQFGQGLLTYSLLSGMRGAALKDDQFVDVLKLFQYSKEEVPKLAGHVGGIQEPKVYSPLGGDSFDIGILTSIQDKQQIPLATPKPFFLRSNFRHVTKRFDNLGIGKLVDAQLTELSSMGTESPLVFIDVPEFPDGYFINGEYTVTDETIRITGALFKSGGEEAIKDFETKGDVKDLKSLVAAYVSEVRTYLAPKN